jgi:hypothetical protein
MRDKDSIILENLYDIVSEHNENILPDVFDQLKKYNNPFIGVHFSNGLDNGKPHLGLNKNPSHHDPIGVYAFPKDYVLSDGLKKNKGFASSNYFYILQPSKTAKILNLSRINERQCKELLNDMGIDEDYWDSKEIYHKSNGKKAGHRLWGVLERVRNVNGYSKNVSWNTLFGVTGYNVLYDEGDGIIHYNEPFQMVYLVTNSYEVLYFGKRKNPINKVYEIFIKSFPDFSRRKEKQSSVGLYMESPTRNYYIKISPWKGGFDINVGGFTHEYKKNYDWDNINPQELSDIVNNVKKFIEDNKENIRYNELDISKNNTIIKLISDHFKIGLKTDKRSNNFIEKRYQDEDKDYVISFKIWESTYGEKKLNLNLIKKGKSYKNSYRHKEFHVSVEVPVNEDQGDLEDINHLMKYSFDKLKERSETYYDKTEDLFRRRQILKTISLIENRVFKLK